MLCSLAHGCCRNSAAIPLYGPYNTDKLTNAAVLSPKNTFPAADSARAHVDIKPTDVMTLDRALPAPAPVRALRGTRSRRRRPPRPAARAGWPRAAAAARRPAAAPPAAPRPWAPACAARRSSAHVIQHRSWKGARRYRVSRRQRMPTQQGRLAHPPLRGTQPACRAASGPALFPRCASLPAAALLGCLHRRAAARARLGLGPPRALCARVGRPRAAALGAPAAPAPAAAAAACAARRLVGRPQPRVRLLPQRRRARDRRARARVRLVHDDDHLARRAAAGIKARRGARALRQRPACRAWPGGPGRRRVRSVGARGSRRHWCPA